MTKLPKKTEPSYSLGLGGGRSRAATASVKPVRAWEPSQNGLLADCPQRQSEITVRPARPKAAPIGSRISKSPSMRMGPLLKTETLVGITGMVARVVWNQTAAGFQVVPAALGIEPKKVFCLQQNL